MRLSVYERDPEFGITELVVEEFLIPIKQWATQERNLQTASLRSETQLANCLAVAPRTTSDTGTPVYSKLVPLFESYARSLGENPNSQGWPQLIKSLTSGSQDIGLASLDQMTVLQESQALTSLAYRCAAQCTSAVDDQHVKKRVRELEEEEAKLARQLEEMRAEKGALLNELKEMEPYVTGWELKQTLLRDGGQWTKKLRLDALSPGDKS